MMKKLGTFGGMFRAFFNRKYFVVLPYEGVASRDIKALRANDAQMRASNKSCAAKVLGGESGQSTFSVL
jgi:hypothetical protein